MKIVEEKETLVTGVELKLLDGRVLHNEEISAEESKTGKEILAAFRGHVCYRSPLNDPKGLFYYEEIEETT